MNKMFKRIESELKIQGKTKVWLADALNESTQNINNWKKRGVPAIKVKAIGQALGLSRDYLEGTQGLTKQRVAAPPAHYEVNKKDGNHINYVIYIDPSNSKLTNLLSTHLNEKHNLVYLFSTDWKYVDPFIELDIWRGFERSPLRVYLSLDSIIGITSYSTDQYPNKNLDE